MRFPYWLAAGDRLATSHRMRHSRQIRILCGERHLPSAFRSDTETILRSPSGFAWRVLGLTNKKSMAQVKSVNDVELQQPMTHSGASQLPNWELASTSHLQFSYRCKHIVTHLSNHTDVCTRTYSRPAFSQDKSRPQRGQSRILRVWN